MQDTAKEIRTYENKEKQNKTYGSASRVDKHTATSYAVSSCPHALSGSQAQQVQSRLGLLGSLKTEEFRLLFEVDFFTDLYSFWDPFWGHFVVILAVETQTKTLRISRSFPGVVRAVPGALQARKV